MLVPSLSNTDLLRCPSILWVTPVLMNLPAGQQWRHRHREQIYGHGWGKERVGRIERIAWKHMHFSSVQFSHSVMSDSVTPWTAGRQASLFFTIFQSLLKLMSIELVMSSGCLILCLPLLLLPSIFPSIRVFSIESDRHIRWPKYWSFSTSPSNEYSGLISFRTDWFDLLAVQGTLKIQDYNTKASILRHSAFFMVQISHPYMTP